MGIYDGLDDVLKDDKYSSNSSSLEELVYGSYLSSKIILPKPRITPSFTSEYNRMRRLAAEKDDFETVFQVFKYIANRTANLSTAKQVLIEAHQIYIQTQKRLAKMFGNLGDFEEAEKHIKNAYLHCEIQIGSGKVILKPKITDKQSQKLFDNAIKHTDPAYFLRKVYEIAENGNVQDIGRYINLVLKSFQDRKIIEFPDYGYHGQLGDKYEDFLRLQFMLGKLHKKAYNNAVNQKVAQAIGYSVSHHIYPRDSAIGEMEKLRQEVKDILLDKMRTFVPKPEREKAFTGTIDFFNMYLNPLFDFLGECRQTANHPLKTLLRPTIEQGHSHVKISGFKRVEVRTTDILLMSHYENVVQMTGIPFYVGFF